MAKRTFDICLSLAGILVLSPLIAGLALLIKLTSPGPVLYCGVRVGRHNKPFRIMKFRSMVVDAEKIGAASTAGHDPRITGIGHFMRKCKLDELPQLFNVLFGTMSFVGPRPEVQKFVDLYTDEEQIILEMRPGITDWASIWNSDEGHVLDGAPDADAAYAELIRPTKLELAKDVCPQPLGMDRHQNHFLHICEADPHRLASARNSANLSSPPPGRKSTVSWSNKLLYNEPHSSALSPLNSSLSPDNATSRRHHHSVSKRRAVHRSVSRFGFGE